MAPLGGRLVDLATGLFLRTAEVTAVDRLSSHFVSVELTAAGFKDVGWTPGQKLQIRPVRGTFGLRAYTPTRWNADEGSTELIAYTHGSGPAAAWFQSVRVGDACEVFGPRNSLDLADLAGDVVFVGDESTIALASALRSIGSHHAMYVFEASDPIELSEVLTNRGFSGDFSVAATSQDAESLCRLASAAAGRCERFDLVLSGSAASVAAVRRHVREWPIRPSRTKVKAYWALGRTGLD